MQYSIGLWMLLQLAIYATVVFGDNDARPLDADEVGKIYLFICLF